MFGWGRHHLREWPEHILVVEDEALVAFDNEHALTEAGFIVVGTVDTAEAALHAIARGGVDLIVADMHLRGEGNGLDVARAAHAVGIPLLFVSARCPAGAKGVASGFLAKPYAPRDLPIAIRAIAARRAGRKTGRLPRTLTLFD